MAPPLLVQALRLPFLTGSLLPVVMVAAWVWKQGPLSWGHLGLTLLGVAGLHLGANLLNDYFDAKGSDPINRLVTPFSGGSRVIQQGRLSAAAVFALGLFFLALGVACGVGLVAWDRPWVILVGALGLAGGVLYSATPVALMSRGLGEAVIFLVFGPVLTWGAGYALTGRFSATAFLLGLPLAWLITAVLWINQMPDAQADQQAGKRTLVVRLGPGLSRVVFAGLMLMPLPSIALLVYGLDFTPWLWLGGLGVGHGLGAIAAVWRHYHEPEKLLPAQAKTIQTHLATAVFLTVGLLLG